MLIMQHFGVGVKPVIEITKEIFGHPIMVTAIPAGSDWNVIVLGGCAPHVGSISLAEYNDGSVTLQTLLRDTHKDQIVGDHFAHVLAQQLRCTVCVSCGIHFDKPCSDDLERIVSVTEEILTELCHILK